MKLKRTLFLVSLLVLFVICFFKMNEHYDELARYPYELNEEERSLVLKHMDTEEIDFLVSQKIEPSQFLPYIDIEGFQVENTLWYDKAYHARKEDKSYIVSFINKYRSNLQYTTLDSLLKTYSYNVLTRYFDEGDGYQSESILVPDPSMKLEVLKNKETFYTYEPDNLVNVSGVPVKNKNIKIKKEVLQPLQKMAKDAKEINNKTFGDMEVTAGYISYENQVSLYEEAVKKYKDEALSYTDYPGRNEAQLGYTIELLPKEDSKNKNKEETKKEEQEQAIWLKDNAYKYGFVIRYPKQKEDVTHKAYQPYILRYVGEECAKYMHDKGIVMEELIEKDIEEFS